MEVSHSFFVGSFFWQEEDTLSALEGTMSDLDEAVLFGEQAPTNVTPQRKVSRTGNLMPPTNTPSNKLDHSPTNPLINKLHTMRSTVNNCPQIWSELAKYCPNERALFDHHLCDEKIDFTFAEAYERVRKSASIFKTLGVQREPIL